MIVLDGTLKSKALTCLVFSILLVLARGDHIFEPSKLTTGVLPQEARLNQSFNEILRLNKQITVFLPGKHFRVFRYVDEENRDHNLSVTVIPCSSAIKWSIAYGTLEEANEKENFTASYENNDTRWLEVDSMDTVTVRRAKKGVYRVVFYPLGMDTLASVYVTMDSGGQEEVTSPPKPTDNMVLIPQRGRRLKVTWKQRRVNPENTRYCLVVNTHKEYRSLCGAEEEGRVVWGLDVPVVMNLKNLKLEKKWRVQFSKNAERRAKGNNDTVIVCVDHRTELTFTKLKKRVKYYFNLFAIDNKTNLTLPYGKYNFTYNFTAKPISLKDGISKSVDLKTLDGKAVFRYRVRNPSNVLHIYVLVCGGAVNVKVKRGKGSWTSGMLPDNNTADLSNNINGRGKGKERLPKSTPVVGYKRFKIPYPAEGGRYEIKVNAPNVDELKRIKFVEVLVTSQPVRKHPFPLFPDDSNLYEFKSQKSCSSVTIGWIPARNVTVNKYCVSLWENRKFNYADIFRGYFQCELNGNSRRKGFYFPWPRDPPDRKNCVTMDITNKSNVDQKSQGSSKNKTVTNYKVLNLKPGRSYTVQVTVKKENGRTLSYKFLKVHTKHACEEVAADNAHVGNESV